MFFLQLPLVYCKFIYLAAAVAVTGMQNWTACVVCLDPGAAGAEGPRLPGPDASGAAPGEGSPGDATVRKGGGKKGQRYPAAAEAAKGGGTHIGEF